VRGTKAEHDDLHKELEQELYMCHEKLGSIGSSMLTCGSCGRRHPDVTLESCKWCTENPKTFTFENGLSIWPRRDSLSSQDLAECDELATKIRSLTHAECGLIRIAVPLVSIHRLPKGQFAFKGH